MERSIQDLARLAGTTSRTLRHYDQIGLLPPSRIGANGYRYYDDDALLRLQRVLLLRELGLSLPAIAEVLDGQRDHAAALQRHRAWLEQERSRIDRQLASVEAALDQLKTGETLVAENMFDGFAANPYRDEAIQRWGRKAVGDSERRWQALGPEGRQRTQDEATALQRDIAQAARDGWAADDPRMQAIVARHYAWVSKFWSGSRDAYIGLGRLYVEDERFAAYYNGEGEARVEDAAELLCEAMEVYAIERL